MDARHHFLKDALDERRELGRFRELRTVPARGDILNFSSNDYLSLASHPALRSAAISYTEMYGTGSTASRLISGNYGWHEQLETRLAGFFGHEAALLFNSGYQANISIIQALANRDTVLLYDRLNHNSLIQGARLSGAKLLRYNHCDTGHLQELLAREDVRSAPRRIIVSESVFSMDGDRAPVDSLINLARENSALLMIDEAHAIGIAGDEGQGLAGRRDGIDIYLATFGKAAGGFGAFVCCSRLMRDYLINFASGFIYTTALPPAVTGAAAAALDLFPQLSAEREHVRNCSEQLIAGLNKAGIDTLASDSHIVPVMVGDEQVTLALSDALRVQGMHVVAIRPPTVSEGKCRLRISLTANHSAGDISRLINAIENWFHENQ
ncbi:MAG: 8-amino-7-oxononanoate synthase [Balneolaceae bacterium]|nr:MAG: 8-amino-7-oxononanoate synthase [Balneolaceae bacterium]